MIPPRKSSIKRKVTIVIMRASIGVLLVTVAAFMIYDLVTFRETMVQNLFTEGRTIADNSTAALTFGFQKDATDVLASLRTDPHIVAAAFYDAHGKLFVKYPASITNSDLPVAPQGQGHQFGKSRLIIFQPVIQSGKQLGTLYLESDVTALSQRIQLYGVISLLIMAASLLVAWWLSNTLQRRITNPIVALAEITQKISKEQNYSLRATKSSDDELGSLTDAFNEMLERIQAGNSALQESELRASERAGELAVVIEAVPVPLIIVHDAEARHMTGNKAAADLVRIPGGGEISKSAPDDLKPSHFKSFKDGRELRPDELPAQRAARGEPVKDFEFDLVFDDGKVLNLLGAGTPLLDKQGRPRGAVHTLVDITERQQAGAIIRQNAALFSALVELAPTGMYVVDGQFRLQQINARALPAFEKVEPKIGRDFGAVMEILWGTEVGAQLAGIFRHTLDTGEPYRSPRFAEHRHDLNEDKAYEWETQRVTLPDGTHGVVCYFNDITETERNKANLAFLATIGDDLLRLDTAENILNTVCAKICDYLKLTIGCFVEINEAADISNVIYEWRQPEMPGLIGTYKLSEYLSPDFQKILRAGECFIVRDTAADPRTEAEKYVALKIRSFICVPLIADGRWKFMFDIHDSKPRDWRADEITLVRELTERIWARLERVRADSLLRQNEALFAALIEEAPVGVYVVNAEFRIQQINTRALPAFEKVEPKMGRTLTEVMHIQWGKEAGDELAAIFRHTLDTGEPYVSPGYSNIRADLGVENTFEWQTRRVTLPNGSHGVVCYFNDITKRIQSEQALMQAKTAAETANRAKDDFLAALSHELRTPLNPVLLVASDAANNPQLPASTRADFDMIRRNVELEARLIDDLLDLTRITRGKLSLNQHPLDVHVVLEETIGIVRADAETKQITLALDFRAEEHVISGDSIRLQQIFWNVLKNAVKFTPTMGNITLKTFAQAGAVFIEIIDSGIGMNAAELKRVFNAFAQGDHAEGGSHRFGGLGLGLAISQKLVELHSGFIQAASAGRDQGATFTIKLPLSTQTVQMNDTTNPTPSKNSDTPTRGIRILLVEDHEPTRTALAHLLSRRNFEVLTAASVTEAYELASKNKIDLLISDIGLPDGSGHTLMIELRKLYGLNGIALTGYGMEEDVAHSQKAGFVAHFTKPVRIQSLDSALATALTQMKRNIPG
jgi:PAS domain S-box-containing protein